MIRFPRVIRSIILFYLFDSNCFSRLVFSRCSVYRLTLEITSLALLTSKLGPSPNWPQGSSPLPTAGIDTRQVHRLRDHPILSRITVEASNLANYQTSLSLSELYNKYSASVVFCHQLPTHRSLPCKRVESFLRLNLLGICPEPPPLPVCKLLPVGEERC